MDNSSNKEALARKSASSRTARRPSKSATAPSTKDVVPKPVDLKFPLRIHLRPSAVLSASIPGSVWRQKPFVYDPKIFMPESDILHKKLIEVPKQVEGLRMFLENPRLRMIYGVTGNPDDSKARYFAAYLVSKHLQALGSSARVLWVQMYGGFKNEALDDALSEFAPKPTILVVSNLAKNSTAVKLEKTRDLLEAYSNIPRIVVAAGEDPISFLSTKLYVPVNGLAYFSESLIKQEVEVI